MHIQLNEGHHALLILLSPSLTLTEAWGLGIELYRKYSVVSAFSIS